MRRHVIIGRFGPHDKTRVPKARDEVASTLQLVAGKRLDHGIGHALADLKALHLIPSEIGADMLVVAAHVHAADTRISRSTESQDAWTREIRLVIPVSDQARWTAAAPILVRALNFLTGDRWEVGFRKRAMGYAKLVPAAAAYPFSRPIRRRESVLRGPGQSDRRDRQLERGRDAAPSQPCW